MQKIVSTARLSGFALSALLLMGTLPTGAALAHGGATGVVKERMEIMKKMGENMKRVGAMVKGKVDFDAAVIASDAQVIRDATPHATKLFPAGSSHKPSEALASIWEEWDQFSALFVKLREEADRLQQVAEKGDKRDIIRQFARVGKVCSSCHTDYRKKEEK